MDFYHHTTVDTPASSDDMSSAPQRILIVEDDDIIQRLITLTLEAAGYSIVCANDGEAGWDAVNAANFDLVITDNNMPRLSGIELIRRMRDAGMTSLPVLLISGEIPRTAKNFASLITPGLAVEKPFSMAKLLGHVRANLVPIASPQ